MTELIDQVVERLRQAGEVTESGLREEEITHVETEFGIKLGLVHREFLMSVAPVSEGWWNWRHDEASQVWAGLNRPIEGVLFDVKNAGFWARSWGDKPSELESQLQLAKARLATMPKLIPLYGHRYMVSGLDPDASPVFSVVQTDVVYYGDNLLDYVAKEFRVGPRNPSGLPHISFWSDLAMGLEPDQM